MLTASLGCATTSRKGATPATDAPAAAADFKNLPVDALRSLADEIERQVAEGNREPALTAAEGLVVDTPVIRQAVRTRAARIELVRAMLNSGHAWERRNGRLWVLRTAEYKSSTTGRQRDIDAIMVNGENQDRWSLYEGLIDANKLGRGSLSAIEEIFFDARIKHMTAGQKYEASNGDPAAIAATP
jgi:hypothetical protein